MNDGERISALETTVHAMALDGRETAAWRHEVIRILERISLSQEQSNKLHEATNAKDAAHDNRLADHDRDITELKNYNRTQEAVRTGQWKVIAAASSLVGGLAGFASGIAFQIWGHK